MNMKTGCRPEEGSSAPGHLLVGVKALSEFAASAVLSLSPCIFDVIDASPFLFLMLKSP